MQEMKVYKLYLDDHNNGCIIEVVPAFSQEEAETSQEIPADCELVTTKEVVDYYLETDKLASTGYRQNKRTKPGYHAGRV